MKNNYICDCKHYDFSNKKFKYWEDRNVTADEITIVKYIKNLNLSEDINILHVGVGNSYVYEKLNKKYNLYGITISNREINKSKSYNDNSYQVFFCDKMSKTLVQLFENKKFDIIIDNNLKSYSCCKVSFLYMFNNFVELLNINGFIVTTRMGMNWVKTLKPSLSFNFSEFFHYKLKEHDGNQENIFTLDEAKLLSKKHSLELNFENEIVTFRK
tara:strand:- start:204 stop:845 length:642 start_codon:yes stop_codon:yes gene_type:complete